MKQGGGKGKGSAFEREVCKALSLWVSAGRKEDLFWRSAMSGGRATVAQRRGALVRQAGDICAVEQAGHSLTSAWYIECKFYKSIKFGEWLIRDTGPIKGWWEEARRNARKYGRDPMLIVKQNGWPTLVIARANHLAHWTAPQIRVDVKSCDVSLFADLMLSNYTCRKL
jgi:hypothetical protein